MKAICKAFAATVVILTGLMFAGLASAAEIPTTPAQTKSLTGLALAGPTGLLPEASKQNVIKVAGRYRRWRRGRYPRYYGYRRRRGPGIAAGIVAGVAAAALLSHSARAHSYRGYGYRCDRLYYRCHERGYRSSCRRFYRYCD